MVTLIKTGVKAVAALGTTATVTFSSDALNETTPAAFPAGYTVQVTCVPGWATSFYISAAPSTTAFTATFGTAALTSGGNLYWIAIGYKLA